MSTKTSFAPLESVLSADAMNVNGVIIRTSNAVSKQSQMKGSRRTTDRRTVPYTDVPSKLSFE
jgi:hypothetical protein